MLKSKRILLVFTSLIVAIAAIAQDADDDKGVMRSNDKIYVVVAIVVTILVGLILYIIRLDRKISKLEKEKI